MSLWIRLCSHTYKQGSKSSCARPVHVPRHVIRAVLFVLHEGQWYVYGLGLWSSMHGMHVWGWWWAAGRQSCMHAQKTDVSHQDVEHLTNDVLQRVDEVDVSIR